VAAVGERRWREVEAARAVVVQSEIERYPGRAAGTVGGTFLATFDGPARAIRCASAIVDGARLLGIELRAGLHTGECNVVDGELTGLPIGAAAWVMGQAAPGEILASRTVRDLVGGSSIEFEERDPHLVDAAPGPWRVFRVGRLPRLPGSLVPARAPAPAARGGSVHPLTRREREVECGSPADSPIARSRTTWSRSGHGRRTGCVGTCTSLNPAGRSGHDIWIAGRCWRTSSSG